MELCWCVLIYSHMCIYSDQCVTACMHLASPACGVSYLILLRGNTASPPRLFPPALWTQAAAGDAVWLSTACPEMRSEGRTNSLASWQLDATNQKFAGATGKVDGPVTIYRIWRRMITNNTSIDGCSLLSIKKTMDSSCSCFFFFNKFDQSFFFSPKKN